MSSQDDYEIIENTSSEKALIKQCDSSVDSINQLEVEKSEKFVEKSEKIEIFEKSEKSEEIYENSSFGSKYAKSVINDDEILSSKIEEFLKSEENPSKKGEELFLEVFKKHYFVAVFGFFSFYQVVLNLIDYLKQKTC